MSQITRREFGEPLPGGGDVEVEHAKTRPLGSPDTTQVNKTNHPMETSRSGDTPESPTVIVQQFDPRAQKSQASTPQKSQQSEAHHPKFWVDGTIAPRNISTTVCDGKGNATYQIYGDCARECAVKHEQTHLAEILAYNPKICEGEPEFSRIHNDPAIKAGLEVRGADATLACLDDKLRKLKAEKNPDKSEIACVEEYRAREANFRARWAAYAK